MISNLEVKGVIKSMVPSCRITAPECMDIYKLVNGFALYTREVIKTGNLPLVKECFKTADFLLKEGNNEIKNAIENVYVYSLALFLDVTGAVSKQVKELLPAALREEYQHQLNSSLP